MAFSTQACSQAGGSAVTSNNGETATVKGVKAVSVALPHDAWSYSINKQGTIYIFTGKSLIAATPTRDSFTTKTKFLTDVNYDELDNSYRNTGDTNVAVEPLFDGMGLWYNGRYLNGNSLFRPFLVDESLNEVVLPLVKPTDRLFSLDHGSSLIIGQDQVDRYRFKRVTIYNKNGKVTQELSENQNSNFYYFVSNEKVSRTNDIVENVIVKSSDAPDSARKETQTLERGKCEPLTSGAYSREYISEDEVALVGLSSTSEKPVYRAAILKPSNCTITAEAIMPNTDELRCTEAHMNAIRRFDFVNLNGSKVSYAIFYKYRNSTGGCAYDQPTVLRLP